MRLVGWPMSTPAGPEDPSASASWFQPSARGGPAGPRRNQGNRQVPLCAGLVAQRPVGIAAIAFGQGSKSFCSWLTGLPASLLEEFGDSRAAARRSTSCTCCAVSVILKLPAARLGNGVGVRRRDNRTDPAGIRASYAASGIPPKSAGLPDGCTRR